MSHATIAAATYVWQPKRRITPTAPVKYRAALVASRVFVGANEIDDGALTSKSMGKKYNLGQFPDEESAAREYDLRALEAWGEFAYVNLEDSRTLHSLAATAVRVPKAIHISR